MGMLKSLASMLKSFDSMLYPKTYKNSKDNEIPKLNASRRVYNGVDLLSDVDGYPIHIWATKCLDVLFTSEETKNCVLFIIVDAFNTKGRRLYSLKNALLDSLNVVEIAGYRRNRPKLIK
ncbi:hypothetical protein BpHYR1_049263 [Brachionus plicatilis]|uniref:Uncharacterized protein n=1 Tax=Brachionus plicatilis TaxID=10195 RepID=A0A3M7R6B6_BRAPC|nr:hypothetical protein BpHYR1_049263 [Brachionus plicatilis]